MKKLATTFGLLALMLIVTSFTTPNEVGGRGKDSNGGLGIDVGGRGKNSNGGFGIEVGGRGKDSNGGLGLDYRGLGKDSNVVL
jgi:hypothetical protein